MHRLIDIFQKKFLFLNARDFEHFQQKMLRATILVYLIASLILVPMSVYQAIFTGWGVLYTVHIINLLLFVGLYFMRHRISYQVKAMTVICIFYIVTVTGIVNFGLKGSFNLYFGLCIILSAIFLKFTQTLFLTAIIITTQVVIFVAMLNQWITPNMVLINQQDPVVNWLSGEIAFITLFLTAIIALGSLNNYLKRTIDKLHANEQELLAVQQELKDLALRDALTQLPNRRAFNEFFTKEFALFKRSQTPFCLLMVDLDFFKKVNDTYGHDAGDIVLEEVAQCLQAHTRDDELVARIGGEEFVVLLSRCELPQAVFAAERIRAAIEVMPIEADEQVIKITSSIGVTQVSAEDLDEKSLFVRADKALYLAKNGGRNQVQQG